MVPRDHPSPQHVRSEMDDVVRKYVPEAFGRSLNAVLDPSDPSVWVINQTQLDLVLDLHAAPPDELAGFLAARMAQSIAKIIAKGEDGISVLRFPNRAAYLVQFLFDLACDRAWTKWYFTEFESLRSLPRAAAIREALLREPARAETALLDLAASNRLRSVVSALSGRDQQLVVQCCSGAIAHSSDALRAVLKAWSSAGRFSEFGLLETYLHIRTEFPELTPPHAAGASQAVCCIWDWARAGELPSVVSALVAGRLVLPAAEAAAINTGIMLREVATQQRSLLDGVVSATKQQRLEDVRHFVSPLGGVFLMLTVLPDARELLDLFAAPDDAHLRYLLFLTCFRTRCQDAWRDSALQLAAGLTEVPDLASLRGVSLCDDLSSLEPLAWAEDVADLALDEGEELLPGFIPNADLRKQLAIAAAILWRSFAAKFPGIGRSSIEYLWRNVLAGDAWLSVSPDAIDVRLEPRPLQIVVRMAGLQECKFALPWSKQRVTIRFEEF